MLIEESDRSLSPCILFSDCLESQHNLFELAFDRNEELFVFISSCSTLVKSAGPVTSAEVLIVLIQFRQLHRLNLETCSGGSMLASISELSLWGINNGQQVFASLFRTPAT